jgi:hypothetical protein
MTPSFGQQSIGLVHIDQMTVGQMSVCQMSLTERRGVKLRTKDIFDSDSAEIVLFFVLKSWSRLFLFFAQVFF